MPFAPTTLRIPLLTIPVAITDTQTVTSFAKVLRSHSLFQLQGYGKVNPLR